MTFFEAVKYRAYYSTNPVKKLTKAFKVQSLLVDLTLVKNDFDLFGPEIDWYSPKLLLEDACCIEAQRAIDFYFKRTGVYRG